MAMPKEQDIFGRIAYRVDDFFHTKFYAAGLAVGTHPCKSILATLAFCLLCVAGASQVISESRSDKLWIPQGTQAQDEQELYMRHFPPSARMVSVILEARGSDGALTREFLMAAMSLHVELEGMRSNTTAFESEDFSAADGESLRSLCVQRPADGHPCFVTSVLGAWSYDVAALRDDSRDPVTAINAWGKSQHDLNRMLGDATFGTDGSLTGARTLRTTYFLESRRVLEGGGYADSVNEAWESMFLMHLGCDSPSCDGDECVCTYDSSLFRTYPDCNRARRDAFSSVIRGDIGLINGAFMIMIVYLILNLGGLCHKVNSRTLLAFACVLTIVLSGASGYGLSMWFQSIYTPVHSVLPFVVLGIGVDDSFVIMNAFDRTDSGLPVPERIAVALSHAGASIMVTSATDFIAFMISVSSSLPALSSFCLYAAFTVLFLFLLQVTVFSALVAFDAKRVNANRIDCCPCLCVRGCPCCPVKPMTEVDEALKRGERDPNQLCCMQTSHKGGKVGVFLENILAPKLVKRPVGVGVIFTFFTFFIVCVWQASQLETEDISRKFVPDDSYYMTTLEKTDRYFGTLGESVYIFTGPGDYFASQAALLAAGPSLDQLDSMQPTDGDAFSSWAVSFQEAANEGFNGLQTDSQGHVTVEGDYYRELSAWLNGPGSRFKGDVKWVDDEDSAQGVAATRMMAEFQPFTTIMNDQLVMDANRAVEVMDELREEVDSWSGMPGGKATAFSFEFLTWETFRIIKHEMFLSVGLCLVAVFFVTLGLIAHPLTASLVFLVVCLTIVDILGCMKLWGLAIDSVSVIQLVISVGLCVDYAAHVGHAFMKRTGDSRSDRVVGTLGDVGAAVLNGGISTFLATMVLSLSKSYVFRVLFQTFFLTVVLGLLHGMILLPVLLSLVGPAPYGGVQAAAPVQTIAIGKASEPTDEKTEGADEKMEGA